MKIKLNVLIFIFREAYISKKTSEIFRAYFVLSLCGIKPLVENNDKVN